MFESLPLLARFNGLSDPESPYSLGRLRQYLFLHDVDEEIRCKEAKRKAHGRRFVFCIRRGKTGDHAAMLAYGLVCARQLGGRT